MNKRIALLFVTCLAVVASFLGLKKLSAEQKPAGIMMSEVCSKNERVIYNSTGEYIDYVELYNPLDYAVALSGYRLSDNAAFENAYIIEEGIIESGQYKVIFPKSFGISDYEIVYLLDSSLNVLDSVHIPILAADSSFARDLKRNQWSVMQPAPEKVNVIRAIAVNSEGQKSHEAIGTYFVGYGEKSGYDNLYILSIITDPTNLYDYEKGIYVKGKVWETNWDEKKAQNSSVYKKTALANYKMEGKG